MPLKLKEGLLEEVLIEKYSLSDEQLQQARKMNYQNRLGLLENLQKMGLISEQQSVEIQSKVFGTRLVKLKNYPIHPEATELIPEPLQKKHHLVPLTKVGSILTVATSSLFKGQAAQLEIQNAAKCLINFVLAYPSELEERLQSVMGSAENIDDMLSSKAEELISGADGMGKSSIEDPHGPVAQAVSFIIKQAVQEGASDIHFEPFVESYRIRFRQDGILRETKTFDKVFSAPFTAAVKVKSSIDIAETRMPQDGAFEAKIGGRRVDFRVATYPTQHGEKIVIRILDSSKAYINIDALLLPPEEKDKLIDLIEKPHGLILCSGPTGSGKSTTLYSILHHVNKPGVNILTIEDPIEYRLAGITQGQVNNTKGFTFSSGLRSMMRLDPDIILVGEIRDGETAEIALQAALTGHLVLSTVHSNSASQTISRLTDLGVESFIVGNTINGVISQRLVRKVCAGCKAPYQPEKREWQLCGFKEPPEGPFYKGKGCHKCNQSGYKGRVPLIELLVVPNIMRGMISRGDDAGALFRFAVENGMRTMNEDARNKILGGYTSSAEMIRVIGAAHIASSAPKKDAKAEKDEKDPKAA